MKNWLPFVSGPALAMDSSPGPVCLSEKSSSAATTHVSSGCGSQRNRTREERTLKARAVNGLAARAVMIGEISTLCHEAGDDAVKRAALQRRHVPVNIVSLVAYAQAARAL